MPSISVSSTATPAALWRAVSEVTKYPERLPTFTSVTPLAGAPAVGARFRVSQPGLVSATYEITEWRPGAVFTWVARTPGVVTTARHEVQAREGGSRLELTVDWTGPLGALVRLVLARRAQRMITSEATGLTSVAERE